MKILVVVFACAPGRGSEPGVGFQVARGVLKAGHEVVVLTQRRNQKRVEDGLLAETLEPLEVVGIGLSPSMMDAWERVGRHGFALYSLFWQLRAAFIARSLHRRYHFDVAHQATIQADWLGSAVCLLAGVRRIWGPVGGGSPIPPGVKKYLGKRGRLKDVVRIAATGPLRQSIGRFSAHHSTLVIAVNDERRRWFERIGAKVITQPGTFLDMAVARATAGLQPNSTRKTAVYVGRLVAWKGVRLAIETMAHLKASTWDLWIYGAGPERTSMEKLIRHYGLGERIRFFGQVDRETSRRVIGEADALLYLSFREADSWAVAEARSAGTPVVCVAAGGYENFPSSAGIGVAPVGTLSAALAQALTTISSWDRAAILPLLDVGEVLNSWYESGST